MRTFVFEGSSRQTVADIHTILLNSSCSICRKFVSFFPSREVFSMYSRDFPTLDTNISDKELIGIGSASLGLSSCFDAPFRMYKLTRHRKKYGPLYIPDSEHLDPVHLPAGQGKMMRKLPRNWWHLDFSLWAYQIGLFFFAIPLAIAPAIPL
jgi:hypothetical protein